MGFLNKKLPFPDERQTKENLHFDGSKALSFNKEDPYEVAQISDPTAVSSVEPQDASHVPSESYSGNIIMPIITIAVASILILCAILTVPALIKNAQDIQQKQDKLNSSYHDNYGGNG